MAGNWTAGLAAGAMLLPILLSGCASIDASYQPRILSEDPDSAVMTMGFEYTGGDTFDDGSGADWGGAWDLAAGRCQKWGYSVAVEDPEIRMTGQRKVYGAFGSGMVEREYRCRRNASGARLDELQDEATQKFARRVAARFDMDGCFWRQISGDELVLYCYKRSEGSKVQLVRAIKADLAMPSSGEEAERSELACACKSRALKTLSRVFYASLEEKSRPAPLAVPVGWRPVESGGMEDRLLNLVCGAVSAPVRKAEEKAAEAPAEPEPEVAAEPEVEQEEGRELRDSENRLQSETLKRFPASMIKNLLTDQWEIEETTSSEGFPAEAEPVKEEPAEKPRPARRRSALPL